MTSKMLTLAVFITLFQTFGRAFGSSHQWRRNVDMTVNTTSGLLTGRSTPGYPSVIEFLGVPFAEPPVGPLRFAAPTPYVAKGPIAANHQPCGCTQPPNSVNHSLPQPAQNILGKVLANCSQEDCLYLNVWTKPPSQGTPKKPVLIWLYGGGFTTGSVSNAAEQGALWASEEDVIIVSSNYRLGVFGFPGGAGLSQNAGLLDQRLAIEWVRDNIAAFGGDPTRITLFGHSAGGASIDYYSYAYEADPIVAGLIPMSGTATSFGHRTAATGQQAWEDLAELLGCGSPNTTSSSAIIDCVRGKSTAQVFDASNKAGNEIRKTLTPLAQLYGGITGIWSPTTDGQTIFSNYSIRGQQGRFAKLPTLAGNNIDEGCLFTEQGRVPLSEDAFLTEGIFTCPINWAAIYRASVNLPTWKYRWFASFPNLEFNECPGEPWHGQELFVLFGSSAEVSGEPATPQEIAAGRYLRRAWTAFATDPANGLTAELKWPTFNSNESQVVELGVNGTIASFTVASATKFDAQCFTNFTDGGPDY